MIDTTAPTFLQGLAWSVTDTLTMSKRNLLRYVRLPRLLVFSTLMPVMMLLLFNYVFGGAIRVGEVEYIDYLLPGILVQAVLFGSTQTGVGLADDLSHGMIDRFRSLPMSRAAVLAGRTVADTVRNALVICLMIGVGSLIGFRFHAGLEAAATAFLLAVLFGFSASWFSAFIGMLLRDPETMQVAGSTWMFPLMFSSSMFVPVDTMPDWLQVFAEHQPVTVIVDAVRTLVLGGSTASDIVLALAWSGGILLVFAPLAVWRYQKSV